MDSLKFFQLTREGAVAHLSLNRPDKANCMEPAFWSELPVILDSLEQDPTVRVLLLSGEGKHFSAGMDMSSFSFIFGLTESETARASFAMRKAVLELQDILSGLERARFPVIAAVHGACVGGALDMISACDLRLAAADTKFSIEEANVGMTADIGTLQRLPKLIAPGIVKELALTGRRFTPEEAKSWGFVNAIHPDKAATIEAGIALARDIASKSPLVSAGVKRAIDYARDHTVADSLEQIANWNAGMLRETDMTTAIDARIKGKEANFADLLPTEPHGSAKEG
ncbi:MAG: crotonase/enoyl-CoA hydratase family protein [Sphingorhabdus sp.]